MEANAMPRDLRTEATHAVEEHMHDALAHNKSGALTIIEVDPSGEGVLLARSATLDRPGQLTGQISELFAACDHGGRRPKLIVACAGVPGHKPLEERPDLLAVLGAIDDDRCAWLGVVEPTRIARSVETFHRFVAELEERGAGIFVRFGSSYALDPASGIRLLCELMSAAESRGDDRLRPPRSSTGV
jgi:DNA invertase Pin-like site-specific DNA recombinase